MPESRDRIDIPPSVLRMLDEAPDTEAFVEGSPGGRPHVGMVLKRTYHVDSDGLCRLAPDGDQELVSDDRLCYWPAEPPVVSPVCIDDDTAAFRDQTDLVVQGSARTYGVPVAATSVAVAFGRYLREINVYGERTALWGGEGAISFSEPAPFEEMPIRYDKAYGGLDATALERWDCPAFEDLKQARPEWELGANTPFHYPRNPAGVGFLVTADEESISRVVVPNLEFPFDPITPERLAVGGADLWLAGPLPACMDWVDTGWFPRSAYTGMVARPDAYDGPIAEIDRGWAAPDLFEIPSIMDGVQIRQEFAQAASPGMSVPQLPADAPVEVRNLHPEHPLWRFRLPSERPVVKLGLKGASLTDLQSHLNAVVVRPELDEVVMVWLASAPCDQRFTLEQTDNMRRDIVWLRPSDVEA